MRVLIWDFDGVIVDSVKECFEITLSTIGREEKTIAKEAGISEFFPISFADFEGYRSRSVNAADFFANYIAHQKGLEFSEKNLDAITKNHLPFLKKMDDVFYEEREKLMERDAAAYFQSLPLYKNIPNVLKSLQEFGIKHAIMSARDSVSIKQILAHHNLEGNFEFIIGHELDKGNRHVKKMQIDVLEAHFQKKYPNQELDFYFIDDIPFNLIKVEGKAKLLFASWGYGKLKSGYVSCHEVDFPSSLLSYFK